MSISEPFIRRPIATTLLTIAIALAGAVAFRLLPVSPLRWRERWRFGFCRYRLCPKWISPPSL